MLSDFGRQFQHREQTEKALSLRQKPRQKPRLDRWPGLKYHPSVRTLPYYIAAGLCLASLPSAAADFGGVSSLFMAEGLAVRAMGLSRADSALADDEASLQSNPAGLARSQGLVLGGGHLVGLLDDRASYLSAAWRATPDLGLGLQAAYSGTTEEGRDAFGASLGQFQNSETLLTGALGLRVAQGWRLGLGVKALQEVLAGEQSLGLAGDLGLQMDLPHGWIAGLSLLNAGTQVQTAAGNPALPTPLRLQGGVALPIVSELWLLEADLQGLPLEGQARLLLGTELRFELGDGHRGSLRAGLQSGLLKAEGAQLSVGAGLVYGQTYGLDYALANLGVLGLTHRFSLSLHFMPKAVHGGAPAGDLSAPYGLQVTPQLDGLLVSWSHDDTAVQGYNLYSDYGVLAERLNSAPLAKTSQRFIKVTRSRTYNFYVRPIGADGKEGPSSEIKTVRVK